jgi:cullin-associated NEDD8-dissociated protein 1
LIREVEMGPFKHEVDDGLDLRKAAFECMYTLLDTCVDRLDVFEFLSHVQDGLKDHYDIKMLTYLMVARVAQLCPGAVLTKLDRLVEPLRLTVTTKVQFLLEVGILANRRAESNSSFSFGVPSRTRTVR